MIDFDALVLDKCEDIFAIAVAFTLAASGEVVLGRGVYSSGPVDVIMQDDVTFGDQQTSLGIRLRDYVNAPGPGDSVEIIEPTHPACGAVYWIGDADLDGQGGIMLMLRRESP